MLSIKESYIVYKLLSPYLEDSIFTDDLFDFSSKILNKIIESEQYDMFIQLLKLLLKKDIENLVSMDIENLVPEFLVSLVDNKILDLIEFYRGLNG